MSTPFNPLDVGWAIATLDPNLVATTNIDATAVTRKMRCTAIVLVLKYAPLPKEFAPLRSYRPKHFASMSEDGFNVLTRTLLHAARLQHRKDTLDNLITLAPDALTYIQAEIARRAALARQHSKGVAPCSNP